MEVQNGQNNNEKKPDYINSRSFAFSLFYERKTFFFFF